jgi:hypothetical protein
MLRFFSHNEKYHHSLSMCYRMLGRLILQHWCFHFLLRKQSLLRLQTLQVLT